MKLSRLLELKIWLNSLVQENQSCPVQPLPSVGWILHSVKIRITSQPAAVVTVLSAAVPVVTQWCHHSAAVGVVSIAVRPSAVTAIILVAYNTSYDAATVQSFYRLVTDRHNDCHTDCHTPPLTCGGRIGQLPPQKFPNRLFSLLADDTDDNDLNNTSLFELGLCLDGF